MICGSRKIQVYWKYLAKNEIHWTVFDVDELYQI